MKKLEDIPRKEIFEAPDGYFEKLPGIVQARVAVDRKSFEWSVVFGKGLKYALPALTIAFALFFFLRTPENSSTEELLASVDSAYLVAYLVENEANIDELVEEVPLYLDEAEAVQKNSIMEMKVDAADVEYLSNEFGEDYF